MAEIKDLEPKRRKSNPVLGNTQRKVLDPPINDEDDLGKDYLEHPIQEQDQAVQEKVNVGGRKGPFKSMAEIKGLEPKPVLVVSSDEEEVENDGDVMYLGTRENRAGKGGMKMAITVGEVLQQRRSPLPYAWKCYLGKPDT